MDALNPEVLTAIVEHNIEELIDLQQYEHMRQTELQDKEKLKNAVKNISK